MTSEWGLRTLAFVVLVLLIAAIAALGAGDED